MNSTTRKPRRAYHHGDLKAALVQAASEIVRTKGLEALTLREVARRTGVTAAAPYRHFSDRRALVAAIAERGFERLGQTMVERMAVVGGPAGLKEVALAYVEFGTANAAEYRVMFGPELADTHDFPSLQQTSRAVLGGVAETVWQLQNGGLIGRGDPPLMAVALWATLHGLVMLLLDRQTQS